MKFYISWHPGDPIYPVYDDDCALLVSITSVSMRWRLHSFARLPRYFMLDSGGFHYASNGQYPPPKKVFEQQLRILDGVEVETLLCPLDLPAIMPNKSSNERDAFIHQTLANAYEFKVLSSKYNLPSHIQPIGIVQGYDLPSMLHCGKELLRLGYQRLGIGSLAFIYNPEKIFERVQTLMRELAVPLHVFGISGDKIARMLRDARVTSIDSARPAKAAMFNVIFYSNPVFKRHRIRPTRGYVNPSGYYIEEALPCDCPVCQGKPNPDLLKIGKREYVYLRTLHNYFHLKQLLCQQPITVPANL